jgi:hypothetical protein
MIVVHFVHSFVRLPAIRISRQSEFVEIAFSGQRKRNTNNWYVIVAKIKTLLILFNRTTFSYNMQEYKI